MKRKMKSTLETYSQLKNQFLEKFSAVAAWGDWVSQKRVAAFNEVLDYFDVTEELLEKDEGLRDIIYEDNVDILAGNLISMPIDLKNSLPFSSSRD